MYQEQIEKLVILQSVDDEIILLEKEIEDAPRELAEMEGRLAEHRARQAQIAEKTDLLAEQLKRLEHEIEEDANKIKKSKNKLMLVGNTKEYHAMMREMDNLEKVNRMREEEKVAVLEELGRQEESGKEIKDQMSAVEEEHETKRSTLEARLNKAKKRLAALAKKRAEACKVVPKPIMGRYDFIRSRMENPVIVPVTEGVCAGCHIMIPPQVFNELQKGKQIMACPNCQRLIYWVEHTPAKEAR
ncbi:MAG: C4-type zinc ribbon domain-containing protein [Desulfovibrionaceae bacterium]|nr:hypothetical protein [Desulfovibrionaceae bacterium]MDD4950964.1 C4-type zinc ribbon domain-containing protein [Desulfovibrionaceae bacterium]